MDDIKGGLFEAECLLNARVPKRFRGKALKAVVSASDQIEKQAKQIEELEERIAIMSEPVRRVFYPKTLLWECQGCGECVDGITKYCGFCGREFLSEEDGDPDG